MLLRTENLLKRFNLAQRFMLASLVILVTSMLGVGWWVGQQIQAGVIHRTAATTALYVDSFIAPQLQASGRDGTLTPEQVADLGGLLDNTPLGQQIVAFKVWGPGGRILYSTRSSTIGHTFPISSGLARALQGDVTSKVSRLEEEENVLERQKATSLIETYSPVYLRGTNRVIAVAEFYQAVGALQNEINAAKARSWLVVGAATLAMYLLLAGIVRRGSDTIVRQQAELQDKVARLTRLLAQNEELHERVRVAARRTTALNERFLRRISAELHDGPAQDLSLALLRVDSVIGSCAACRAHSRDGDQSSEDLNRIQVSLNHALREVRSISAGLRLPELSRLTLSETLSRVVYVHQRRTDTKVALSCQDLPEQAPLPVKITVYRVIEEALNNSYRHAAGAGQCVQVSCTSGHLRIEIADQGPGLNGSNGEPATGGDQHLGLVGMRERVESLGGLFCIESQAGQGTSVIANLPLQAMETSYA